MLFSLLGFGCITCFTLVPALFRRKSRFRECWSPSAGSLHLEKGWDPGGWGGPSQGRPKLASPDLSWRGSQSGLSLRKDGFQPQASPVITTTGCSYSALGQYVGTFSIEDPVFLFSAPIHPCLWGTSCLQESKDSGVALSCYIPISIMGFCPYFGRP
jgi:hypothetical protein